MYTKAPVAILLASAVIFFSLSTPAAALTMAEVWAKVYLPSAAPSTYPSATSGSESVNVSASFTNAAGSPGTMTASANGGSSPLLILSGSATSTLGNYYYDPLQRPYDSIVSQGHSHLVYNYRVSGPSNISVPLLYSFEGGYAKFASKDQAGNDNPGSTFGYKGYLNFAGVGLFRFDGGAYNNWFPSDNLLGGHSGTANVTANQWQNVSGYIDLYVGQNDIYNAQVGHQGAGTTTGSVWINQGLIIDPAWLNDHPGYTLEFDIAAPTPVPVPSALFLLGPGLVGLAAMRKRFKK